MRPTRGPIGCGLAVAAVALILLALAVGGLLAPRTVRDADRPAVVTLRPLPVPLREEPAAAEPAPVDGPARAPEDRSAEFGALAAEVTAQCGLEARVACDGPRCVVLTETPDLDRPLGWAPMALSAPRFVGSTALRDLGVPVEALPCGVALSGITGDWGAAVLERPDGSEVWCGFGGAPDGFDARELCSRAAAAHGLGGRFLDPSGRVLKFDR